MYRAPKGEISKQSYSELDAFWVLKINELEKVAAQYCEATDTTDKNNFIRNYTLNKLWPEYCEKQELCNKEYHEKKKKTVGNNIQQVRIAHGLTIQELSETLHITEEKIEDWENGKSMPSISNLNALSDLFIHPFNIYIKNSYYI